MTTTKFPYETSALRVNQNFGDFYVASLPAELLLRVAASDTMEAVMNPDGNGYSLKGTQRLIQNKRLDEISQYINRYDSAFPNSIILAANYDRESGFDMDEAEYVENGDQETEPKTSNEWYVEESDNGCFRLFVPTDAKLAAIIDGQHRLFAFARANQKAIESTYLLCSIYLDLHKAFQAQIFATINTTQKRVDRSLTFELFGYNVEDDEEKYWTPDKLAVFLTRKLSTNIDSPLRGKIIVSPKRDKPLDALATTADWCVSTAVVVDGIIRLFSSKPKRDANLMRTDKAHNTRSILAEGPNDKSPLRDFYIEENDLLIYEMVFNYLKACGNVFWSRANPDSYIFKTIGVQALFDVLRRQLAPQCLDDSNISVAYLTEKLEAAGEIDFSDEQFKKPSGVGRTAIRKAIEEKIGLGR